MKSKTEPKSKSKTHTKTTAKAATARTGTAKTATRKPGARKTTAGKASSGKTGKTSKTPSKTATKTTAKTAGKTSTKTASKTAKKAKTISKKISTKDLTYKVNQQIVYPLQGVGQVTSIEERPFRDESLLYYIIYLEVSDMTIMVPVDRADELGIRAIVNKKESNKALALLAEEHEPITADWKMRYQMNLDLLKKGSVTDIATVVRTLYSRSKIKELPILERKLYDSALRLMVDEVSFSLDMSKEDVEKLIFGQMDKV